MVTHVNKREIHAENVRRLSDLDIALHSYPRTGSNWLRLCLIDLILQSRGHSSGDEKSVDHSNLLPSLGKHLLTEEGFACRGGGRMFKTHLLADVGERRFIYIARNPLDCLRSYFRFSTKGAGNSTDLGPFCERKAPEWRDHAEAALERRRAGKTIFVSYEAMHKNMSSVLTAVSAFIGVAVTEEMIERASRHNTVDRLRDRAHQLGHASASYNFGEGQVGLGALVIPHAILARVEAVTANAWLDLQQAVAHDLATCAASP